MGKQPAFQFYVGDWLKDTRCLSLEAKGAWIDLLNFMWHSETRGKLSFSWIEYTRQLGTSEEQAKRAISELIDLNICDCYLDGKKIGKSSDVADSKGRIILANRRMCKEEIKKQNNAVRQARLREKGGGNPDNWTAIRVRILQRDEYMCAYCGRRANTVDHVIPKTKGGNEDDSNLVACCKRCNNQKTNRTPDEAKMLFWKGYKNLDLIKHQNNIKITSPSSSSSSINNICIHNSKCIDMYAPDDKPSGAADAKKTKKDNIDFNFDEKKFMNIGISDMDRWIKAYPAVNVETEILEAAEWLISNPKNRKSNYRRFLTSWFKRSQDRAPRADQKKRDYTERLQESARKRGLE